MRASYDALVGLFAQIEIILKPLGNYTRISSTMEMAEVYVKITAEVLSILSIATREVTSWRASECSLWYILNASPSNTRSEIYFRNLFGRTDIEDVLKKLDSLIHELIEMAKSEVGKATGAYPSWLGADVTMNHCCLDIKKVSFDIPSEIMCSLSATFVSFVNAEVRLQGRQDWMFENGSLRQTRRLTTMPRGRYIIIYRPHGTSAMMCSRIGCQTVLCFGFTENVRSC